MSNFLSCFYWWRKLLKVKNLNHYMFFYSLNKGWYDINFENFYGKGLEPEKIYVSAEAFDALCRKLEGE